MKDILHFQHRNITYCEIRKKSWEAIGNELYDPTYVQAATFKLLDQFLLFYGK